MGKQAGPSPEELEFIFEGFTRGLSDREVLDEMQDTEFPLRKPRFIRDRRKAFNAAGKVLEITLKQQGDPVLTKAREDHFSDIRNLIEEWKDDVHTPRVDEMSLTREGYLKLPFSKLEYQFNPLFDCLREHLPLPALWQNHSLWIHKIPDYFNSCQNIIKEIIEDDRVLKILEEYPKWEEYVIVGPVLQCISDRALGREPELLNQSNPEMQGLEPFLELTERPGSKKFIERTSKTSFTEEIVVDHIKFVDPVICGDYLNSEAASNLISLFNELKTLEEEIHKSLQEVLARRDYCMNTCRLCPGQAK